MGVTVAYSGVHQAYQLALAAQEAGVLDAFLCSIYAAPGKWGGSFARVFGQDALANRRLQGIDTTHVFEYPWPLIRHHVKSKLQLMNANDWLPANASFDGWTARHLQTSASRVLVGTETCAQRAFEVCLRRDIQRVLDCPQLHPDFLEPLLNEAADRVGIKTRAAVDCPAMAERKALEYEMAQRLLLYSEVHRRSFQMAGFSEDRLSQCPLWADPCFWHPPSGGCQADGPLRVLFVGSLNLRKGVPFLLDAIKGMDRAVRLTLVGTPHRELANVLAAHEGRFDLRPPQTKARLRDIYHCHDVLVLPSLGDSFGFVGLEAMACGLPVIVSANCGVPVPKLSWRVPVMDSEVLTARLHGYVTDRDLLAADRNLAPEFARKYTPQRYRDQIGEVLRQLTG